MWFIADFAGPNGTQSSIAQELWEDPPPVYVGIDLGVPSATPVLIIEMPVPPNGQVRIQW